MQNDPVEFRWLATWIEASPEKHIGMKCSRCKARIRYSEYYSGNHNFCHKCGSRMVKGEKNHV